MLGGLPASSVPPIPHPRPMGQLWGCRQAAAVGWGAGVGLQPPPPLHSDTVLGGTEGAPLLSPQCSLPHPCPMGQLWGCKQAAGVGLQLRGSVLGGTETMGGLPSFSSVLHTMSTSHGAGVGLQAAAGGWGAGVGLQPTLLHSDTVLGGTEGAPLLLLSALYLIHVPWGSCRAAGMQQLQVLGQVWGCSPSGALRGSVQGGGGLWGLLSFSSVLHTSPTILWGSCGAVSGQVWGSSSGTQCWGGSHSQCSVPHPPS